MLETVRAYAREQFERDGARESIERLHGVYFRGLAEQTEPHRPAPNRRTGSIRYKMNLKTYAQLRGSRSRTVTHRRPSVLAQHSTVFGGCAANWPRAKNCCSRRFE